MKIEHSIFKPKYMKYEKNVRMQNCSSQKDLLILTDIISDKRYIFHFNFKKYD